MASQYLGTFYGYSNGSAYGRYNCTLYWDNITRSGTKVTMNNARVVMTKTDTDKYTINRFAGCASINGTSIHYNTTLKAYQTQSPNSITFTIGSPSTTTTGTSFNFYVAIASTGGSSSWGNFQATPLEWSGSISCPSANPTYITKPTITNIQETSLVINRGTTDISSKFYYKRSGTTTWIELTATNTTISSLTANTSYTFDFKVANATDASLTTTTDSITAKTIQFPYIKTVGVENVIIGSMQTLTLHNPLGRKVEILMTNGTQDGTIIYSNTTTGTSHSFTVPIEAACAAIGNSSTIGSAVYYCKYLENIIQTKTGTYQTTESLFRPSWTSNINEIFTYKDGNEDFVNTITKDNQILVQEYSQLFYGVNYNDFPAIASYNSPIKTYQISINNEDFIEIPASSTEPNTDSGLIMPADARNITIAVRAIDSRGYKSNILTTTLNVQPYNAPQGSIEVYREGGYGTTVHLIIHPVWGINSNNIGTATYAFGKNGGVIGTTTSTSSFDTIIPLANFDNEASFTFEVILTDKLGRSSNPIYGSIGIGEPILFIDVGDGVTGIGVNCFPETKGMYVKGDAVFQDNAFAKQNLTVEQNAKVYGYLEVGSHRRQTMIRNGEQRTGWFYTGGNQ